MADEETPTPESEPDDGDDTGTDASWTDSEKPEGENDAES